jgi:hypothetical protein
LLQAMNCSGQECVKDSLEINKYAVVKITIFGLCTSFVGMRNGQPLL